LALGKVKKNGFLETTYQGSFCNAEKRYDLIKQFESERVKPVEYKIVDLNSEEQCQEAVDTWRKNCANGSEGWVVKTYDSLFLSDDSGTMILPFLKIRGPEYLRLVYGIDYLEDKYFQSVCKRNIGGKRHLSRLQHELSDNVMKSYLKGEPHLCMLFCAAFHGSDYNLSLNATL